MGGVELMQGKLICIFNSKLNLYCFYGRA